MYPVLFEIGGVPVYTYGVLHLLAVAAMTVFGALWFRAKGAEGGIAVDAAMAYPYSMFILARIPYVILEYGFTARAAEAFPRFTDGGFWGGLAILLVFLAALGRARRFPLPTALDLFSPPVLLSLAVGKLGCLFGGCCWGGPSGGWPGLNLSPDCIYGYPEGPLHPLPLYDSFWAFAGVALLLLVARRRRRPGFLFLLFILWYSLERFFSEFLRYSYTDRTDLLGLYPSQVVELACAVSALVLLTALFARLRAATDGGDPFLRIRDAKPPSGWRTACLPGRIAAFFVDSVPAAGAFAVSMALGGPGRTGLVLLGGAAYLGVFALPVRTPGMRLFGLEPVREDGRPPGIGRRLLRALILPVPLLSLAGLFRPLASRSRQTFHDMVSGVFVVTVKKAKTGTAPAV